MARTTKSENKTVVEKASKVLSSKKQSELDHLQGKHTIGSDSSQALLMSFENSECGFCKRRVARLEKKRNNAMRFYTGQKK